MTSCAELDQSENGQHSQDISSSALLDCGSISFGRFAVESLAWEKWSVFRHNRCQEELEMYKSNGLVAQKKAFFEEYYKKVRALKALQSENQENQETAQIDKKSNSAQLENGNSNNDLCREEMLGHDAVTRSHSSAGSEMDESKEAKQEPLNDGKGNSNSTSVADEPSNVEREKSTHEASASATSPVSRSSGTAKRNSLVLDTFKHNANERKKLAPVSKVKGNASSTRNKSKLDCSITKDAVRAVEKLKPLPLNQITGKRDNIILPSKNKTRMAATTKSSNQVPLSHKQPTVMRSSAPVLHPSSTRNITVPSSPSCRSHRRKANINGKDVVESLQTSQHVHAQAVQNPSKKPPITSDLKDKAQEKRTCPAVSRMSSELGTRQMRPKVCQSQNQRPNYMLTNLGRNRLIQDTEAGRKDTVGGEGSNSICRRDPKSAYNRDSSIQKNLKMIHKEKEESSVIRRRDPKPFATVASSIEKNLKPLHKTVSRSEGLKHAVKGTKI